MEAARGSFVAFATAPGSVAADGTGRNGIYTERLLSSLKHPDGDIDKVFRRVAAEVAAVTSGKQVPWVSSSLTGDFYFRTPVAAPVDDTKLRQAEKKQAELFATLEEERKKRNQEAIALRQEMEKLRQGEGERAELATTLGQERKKRAQEAAAVKQEMEKLRAELQKIRTESAAAQPAAPSVATGISTTTTSKPAGSQAAQHPQVAMVSPPPSPTMTTAPVPSAAWAPRLALLEKLRGQLTLSKAIAILLDISAADDLNLVLTHEANMKRLTWQSAYAVGIDSGGNLIWSGSRGWGNFNFATDTALEHCARSSGAFCKVVMVNGEFKEQGFFEVAQRLRAQNPDDMRQAYLQTLRQPYTESRYQSSTIAQYGFSSPRDSRSAASR